MAVAFAGTLTKKHPEAEESSLVNPLPIGEDDNHFSNTSSNKAG